MAIIALDIETLERPLPEGVEEQKKAEFQLAAEKAYKKEETIAAHAKEDFEKWKERWKFSRRGAQILCVGVGVLDGECRGFSIGHCLPSADEKTALEFFVDVVQSLHVTKIVTANGYGFDLPILIAAMARHGLYLPRALGKWGCVDLFKDPFEKYAASRESLESLCEIYGVEWPSDRFPTPGFSNPDGSQVAAMWEQDCLDGGTRVKNYCLADVWCTAEIYNRLSRFVEF